MRGWELENPGKTMETMEKPDSFLSLFFLDQLNLLESRKEVL
jgi:hypothetical protein